jgi:hypothetical protein
MLTALGSTYQALQQWEEAHNALSEAVTMAEKLDFKGYAVPEYIAALYALLY